MIISILLSILLSFAFPPGLPAASKDTNVTIQRLPDVAVQASRVEPTTSPPPITAAAAGVWDSATRAFVYERDIDAVHAIASVTKLMTVLVALESGVRLDEAITITRDDIDAEGSRVAMTTGSVFTVRDLFSATLIASANNAAEALVRSTGTPEAAFVEKMNMRAAQLGMASTHFTDVTGLGPRNTATVRDLTLLADAAFAQPLVAELTRLPSAEIVDQSTGKRIRFANTNELTGSDLRILAAKTGYSEAARGTLCARIRGNGERDLLVIVLESSTRETRFSDSRALADWAFSTN